MSDANIYEIDAPGTRETGHETARGAARLIDAERAIYAAINLPGETRFPALDPRGLYCAKTGQRVGTRDTQAALTALSPAHADAGTYIECVLQAGGMLIHPGWLDMSPAAIDAKLEQEPVAAIAYLIGLICRKYTARPQREERADIARYHWALARAYATLEKHFTRPDRRQAAKETALQLCDIVAYGAGPVRRFGRFFGDRAASPDTLALEATKQGFCALIDKALKDYQSASIGVAMETAYTRQRGPSHIKRTRRAQKRVKADYILDTLFDAAGFDFVRPAPERGKKLVKLGGVFGNVTAPREQTRDELLDAIDAFDFGHIQPAEQDDDDTDENTVEVRTISRAEADWATGKVQATPVAPEPAQPRPSILQQIAAKRETEAPAPEPAIVEVPARKTFGIFAARKAPKAGE